MKIKSLLFLFFAIAGTFILSSYSTGYASSASDDLTGANGTSTGCSCHTVSSLLSSTTLELDSAGIPVHSYRPGQSYTVKIIGTNSSTSNLPQFGFQISAVKLTGAGTTSLVRTGTWGTSLPTNVQNTAGIIQHSSPLSVSTGTGTSGSTYVVSIPWTAPAAGTGSVKFYGVLLASNANGNNQGDKFKIASPNLVTEATVATSTASVSIAITAGSNPICAGQPITFTATPTNGGTSPQYQWQINGANAPSLGTSVSYTTSALTSGQIVTCKMVSNLPGVAGSPATSNGITMQIKNSSTGTLSASICNGQSYTFNGIAHTAAGTFLDTLVNAAGCDSFLTLNLTIKQPTTGSISKSICTGQSYTFNGIAHTTAGTFLDTLVNAAGCDSFLALNLSITTFTTGTATGTICPGHTYSYNGKTYTAAGTYKDTLHVAGSCDSIVTLTLAMGNYVSKQIAGTFCTNHPYNFYGKPLSAVGTYKDTIPASSGCDTIVYLSLTQSNYNTKSITSTICAGHTFHFYGKTLSSPGTYIDTVMGTNTCDSIITLTLTQSNYLTKGITASICQGSSYNFYGKNITAAGNYLDTVAASSGCDSIIGLTLTVNPSPTIVATQTATNTLSATAGLTNYQWFLNGTAISGATSSTLHITASGSYTVSGMNTSNCSATSAPLQAIYNGIQDLAKEGIRVYPIPAKSQLNVTIENFANVPAVTIYDLLGNLISVEKVNQKLTIVNIENLQSGVYFIRIADNYLKFTKE